MINVSGKICRESQKHKFCIQLLFFFFENLTVYETGLLWKNKLEPDRPQITTQIRRMRLAYWIFKATSIHSEYVVLLGFAQQWLRERSSMLSLYV